MLANGLSIGILSPPNLPFSLFLLPNYRGQLLIRLQWCESGTFPVSPANFVAKAAKFELVGLITNTPVTITDTGSGYLSDGRCFRILATSGAIAENLSFTSLNINFNVPGAARKRRATSYIAIYTPVGANDVLF